MPDNGFVDAEKVAHQAEEVNAELREMAREIRHRAEDVKKEVVKQLNNTADTIRKESRHAKAAPEIQENMDTVARGLERAAHYLHKNSLEDMGEDVTRTVKRNPWQMLAAIFVIGVVVGMILRGDNDSK